ncbi:MAG: hypothetical protein LUQ09_07515, partial [Methanomassiliicoccales archaeon]|nr:hypothetical protein [Methanomassiliicoccales archaeon]
LVVAIIIIAASALSYSIYQTIEDNRVAYITVKVDKESFSAGENVTFRLEAVSKDVEFNVSDPGALYGGSYGGVNIYRIPDVVDPDDLFDGTLSIHQLNFDSFYGDSPTRVHYDYFDSDEGPLEMSWNGSMLVHDRIFAGASYQPATSGYYLIVPDLEMAYDDHVVCILDESAVFYYDSFDLKLDIVNNPDTNITVTMSMQASPGTVGEMACDLYTEMYYHYYEEGVDLDPNHPHNETGFVITADSWTNLTFTFDVAVPDHGYPEDGGASFTDVQFYGTLVTPLGNYTFYFSAFWNGGWEDVSQY